MLMDTTVTENVGMHRFELEISPDAIAAAYYRDEGGRVALIHTEVPSEYAGHGIATKLAAGTFELIRRSGRRAVIRCPFLNAFYANHPEYSDVVDG
jgi:predicted GNAT family acetyltransferase